MIRFVPGFRFPVCMKTYIRSFLGAVLTLPETRGFRWIAPALALLAVARVTAASANDFVPDELLVSFQPGARGAEQARNALGASRIKAWPEINAEHWHLPPGLGVEQAVRLLANNPNVVFAEPNYVVRATDLPNDARLPEQWSVHNIALNGGVIDADIDAPEAWAIRTDASSIVVGVLDSGIDYNHPDLAANLWTNAGEMGTDSQGRNRATNGVDDDLNGYVDDWRGWNFVSNNNDPFDDNSHGTHAAGILGAVGNNGIGVAGVAWSVKLMPLKHLDANGNGAISAATDAVLYAAKFVDGSGRKIVQITSHSYGSYSKSRTFESALKNCGALVVAGAGNDAVSTLHYPAAYALPNIVAVAATDSADAFASFSNFGSWVQVAAPGVNILSTLPGNAYGLKTGTSMATPHVSGVAALALAQNPGISTAGLKALILGNVDVVPGLAGKVSTSGRVNARKVLGAPELPPDNTPPPSVIDLAASPTSATSVTLNWTVPTDDVASYWYDLRWSRSPITTDAEYDVAGRVNYEPNPGPPGSAESTTVEGLPEQSTLYFALKTTDWAGNVSPLSNQATAQTPEGDWSYVRLDWGYNMGNHVSLGVTDQGMWAVAYDDLNTGVLRCASLLPSMTSFTKEAVMSSSGHPSLVYSSSTGEIGISHRYGTKLYYCLKSSGAWVNTAVDSKDVAAGETSVALDNSGAPSISYLKGGRSPGLYVARRNGTTWSTQQVDSQAKAAIYNQMAMDPTGNPGVAYSHDADGNGSVDTLRFAQFNGSTWTKWTVEAGGSFATVAYSPADSSPALAHWNAANGKLQFVRWNGSAWVAETVSTASTVTGCSLAFDVNGVAYLAFGTDEMLLAKRDPAGGWTILPVDSSTSGSLRNSIKGRPFGIANVVAFKGPRDPGYQVGPTPENSVTVRLAIRRTAYP